jgi:hypothetical protein
VPAGAHLESDNESEFESDDGIRIGMGIGLPPEPLMLDPPLGGAPDQLPDTEQREEQQAQRQEEEDHQQQQQAQAGEHGEEWQVQQALDRSLKQQSEQQQQQQVEPSVQASGSPNAAAAPAPAPQVPAAAAADPQLDATLAALAEMGFDADAIAIAASAAVASLDEALELLAGWGDDETAPGGGLGSARGMGGGGPAFDGQDDGKGGYYEDGQPIQPIQEDRQPIEAIDGDRQAMQTLSVSREGLLDRLRAVVRQLADAEEAQQAAAAAAAAGGPPGNAEAEGAAPVPVALGEEVVQILETVLRAGFKNEQLADLWLRPPTYWSFVENLELLHPPAAEAIGATRLASIEDAQRGGERVLGHHWGAGLAPGRRAGIGPGAGGERQGQGCVRAITH